MQIWVTNVAAIDMIIESLRFATYTEMALL